MSGTWSIHWGRLAATPPKTRHSEEVERGAGFEDVRRLLKRQRGVTARWYDGAEPSFPHKLTCNHYVLLMMLN